MWIVSTSTVFLQYMAVQNRKKPNKMPQNKYMFNKTLPNKACTRQVGVFAVFAHIFTVDQLAREAAVGVQGGEDALVHADTDVNVAFQVDAGGKDRHTRMHRAAFFQQASESFHFTFLHVLNHTRGQGGAL